MRHPCCPCCPRDDAGLCTEAENGSHAVPCTLCAESDEINRLRAELIGERRAYDSRAMHWDALKERAERAEAKLARVRDLCAYQEDWDDEWPIRRVADILAAIEGEQT